MPLCLEAATGKELWRQLLVPKDNHHQVKGPVNGPLVDGERVYFFPYVNEKGDIYSPRCPCICLKAGDGATVWREDKEFNCSEGTTPVIVGDVLYIGGGGKENACRRWTRRRGSCCGRRRRIGMRGGRIDGAEGVCGWGVADVSGGGNDGAIVVGVWRNDLMGVDAKTGKLLWHWKFEKPASSGMGADAGALGDRLLLSASQGRRIMGSVCR